jgi:Histidine kinase-, DNA gyrase B-, and HSP90-like ATPase/Response regulator receiver domain
LQLTFPPQSVTFMADRTRLNQIIGNLLSNASKYTARGGRIQLFGMQEGSSVVIRCKDNGEGIDAADLERIFEPFVRGLKTQPVYGEPNLGIGLALAKQLTQLHRGAIESASAGAGMGSEFAVRLPIVPPPASSSGTKETQIGPTASSRCSILIVDDNTEVAEVMKMALEQAGHKVQLFSDADSVLSASPDLRADAVLLDIGLPGMNGYELATGSDSSTNCVARNS